MDVKITLSFEETIAQKAKEFAAEKGMSLSRMVEYLFERLTAEPKLYNNLESLEISPFVNMVAEDMAEYVIAKPKRRKTEYYESRK